MVARVAHVFWIVAVLGFVCSLRGSIGGLEEARERRLGRWVANLELSFARLERVVNRLHHCYAFLQLEMRESIGRTAVEREEGEACMTVLHCYSAWVTQQMITTTVNRLTLLEQVCGDAPGDVRVVWESMS